MENTVMMPGRTLVPVPHTCPELGKKWWRCLYGGYRILGEHKQRGGGKSLSVQPVIEQRPS